MTAELFDMAPCGFFSFLDNGTILHTNQTFRDVLNYSNEEINGRQVENFFTLPTRIFYQTHLFPLVKMHGHAEEIFLSLQNKEGEFVPVLLNARRMEWEGQNITTCAFIVVPNRKKFEDELVAARNAAETALRENSELMRVKASLQQQAEQLDTQIQIVKKQNQEFKQLNHVVTHNLKEPLRKILMYAGKLKSNYAPRDMERLGRASEQMRSVVTGLQEYVWLDEKRNHFDTADLNVLLRQAMEQVTFESGPDQLLLHAEKLPVIQGDPEQIQLLFYHILNNAVKFRKGNVAKVVINCTLLKNNSFKAVEEKYKYEDFVRMDIRDEGTGFDPAYREMIFELFRKLSAEDGQGIGLALCRKVVENHFGRIEADSRVNEYTMIRIWLPLQQ